MKMAAYDVDKFFTNSPPVVVLYYPPVTLRRTPSSHKTGRLFAMDSLYKKRPCSLPTNYNLKVIQSCPFSEKLTKLGQEENQVFKRADCFILKTYTPVK